MLKNSHTRLTDARFWVIFILFMVLSGWGLAQVDAQEPALPQTPPTAEVGLAIFADRCANCHGPIGNGDGELSTQLPKPPRKLNDPEFLQTAVPATLFDHITNGIIESGMPPFGPASSNPVSEENRWNLIAAVFSLGTSETSVGMGQAVYDENCAACHGETGLGDGPDATPDANLDLTDLTYWFNRSNETVLADIPGDIVEHEFTLSDAEKEAVVHYARTFSYTYVAPVDPSQPIADGLISGQVSNGATGEIITEGIVQLRAYTPNFEETLNVTTTLGIDGRYQFELPSIQPDWVFLAGMTYGEIGFSSNAAQLTAASPTLNMPILVYGTTTNPEAIVLEQVHLVIDFQGDAIQVSELYIINNIETAVFVGATGNPDEGTIQFTLPEGAENPFFERTLGSMDSTIPATEIITTADGWADTLPMYPGGGGLNLIVSYILPYEDGMTLSHALPYAANSANVIMTDAGVSISGNGWDFQGAQEMPGTGTSFLSYAHAPYSAGDSLAIKLTGEPSADVTNSGSVSTPISDTNQLVIGGAVLLIVIIVAAVIFQNWRTQPDDYAYDDDDEEYEEYEEEDEEDDDVAQLLQAIADLDDAHERGDINDNDYASQREQLKTELKSLWQ